MISVIEDQSIEYPGADECFSPDERYPEYRYSHVATRKNLIYKAIRDCFMQASLDRANIGTPAWNPLGEFIPPGSKVFLLCNFANERRPQESVEDYRSRCSHGSVIRALIDFILIATGPDGTVKFGNAPTQFCHWDAVLKDTEADRVLEFYRSLGIPVEAKDLRLYVTDATQLGSIKGIEKRAESDGIHVLLNQESLFSELDRQGPNRYRVMNYDPRRTDSYQSNGHHEYVINRQILEADVIFSAPKLKTHEKVGISCALKGMVGTVGHKDSLPHHRFGSPSMRGDEYPADQAHFMDWLAAMHEHVQKTKPDTQWGSLLRVAYKVFRRLVRRWTPVVDGAWWGNDTAWRMVLDLARIASYADADGRLHSLACRKHLVLTDGIIGGEGDGPAYSTAMHSGALSFADNLVAADFVNATMMGFDPWKIPLIYRAACLEPYPLISIDPKDIQIQFNGRQLSLAEFSCIARTKFEPQNGWKQVL